MNVPDTTSYLFLGLGAIFAIGGLFVASLILRFRSYQKDLALLRQLAEEERQ